MAKKNISTDSSALAVLKTTLGMGSKADLVGGQVPAEQLPSILAEGAIVQSAGTSTASAMSQKTVTDKLEVISIKTNQIEYDENVLNYSPSGSYDYNLDSFIENAYYLCSPLLKVFEGEKIDYKLFGWDVIHAVIVPFDENKDVIWDSAKALFLNGQVTTGAYIVPVGVSYVICSIPNESDYLADAYLRLHTQYSDVVKKSDIMFDKTSGLTAISTDLAFNKLVKEIYLNGLDTSNINYFIAKYGQPTGDSWYNALYMYTDIGDFSVFQETFATQNECIEKGRGVKWNYTGNMGALIDFSAITFGSYTLYPSFNIPLTMEWMPNLNNYHQNDSTFKNTDWYKCLFSAAICIGTSVTEGNIYDYPYHVGVVPSLSYPAQLAKLAGWTCENAGESGITTLNWWATKFANYNYANYHVAFIELGYNGDLTDTLEADAPVGTDYNNYANTNTGRYCSIIEGLLDQNPKIIINLIICSDFATHTGYEVIKKIGVRYGLNVIDLTKDTYIDLKLSMYHGYADATKQGQDIKDYVHFNAVGYAAKAHSVFAEFTDWCSKNVQIINNNHIY